MSISLGLIQQIDDLTAGVWALTRIHSQKLGEDKVVTLWTDPTTDDARFSVTAIDGTVLISATSVDPTTKFDGLFPLQSSFAARENPDGTITIHYSSDDDGLFPLNGTHFTRSFSADGTPTGPSVQVAGITSNFQSENSVAIQTSTNKIAIAHDQGFTLLNADGTIAAGSAESPGFRGTDNGFDIVEFPDGRLLVVSTDNSLDFSTFRQSGPINGQFYSAQGTAEGQPFVIAQDVTFAQQVLGGQSFVSADVLEDGRFVVVYSDSSAEGEGETGITAQIFNSNGTPDGPSFLGNPDATSGAQYFPQVNALDTGGFVISYETDDVTANNVSPLFRLQEFYANGEAVGPSVFRETNLTAEITGQIYTVLLRDGRGMVIDELGGAAVINVQGGTAPVDPLAGPDTLIGTVADEVLDGGGGDDIVSGGGGADTLTGGTGDDYVFGDSFELRYALAEANQVFRLYQATFDRAPDETGHKNWAQRLFTDERTLAEVTQGFVGSQEFNATYAGFNQSDFVKAMYRNVLDRDFDMGEVTDAEIAGWTGRMAAGLDRAGVVIGFSESAEFKATTLQAANKLAVDGNPAAWSDDVYRLYRATLDRDPDANGFAAWSERLADGRDYLDVISGFVDSTEFTNTYGALTDPTAFVTQLYSNVLDRLPDAQGLASWVERLETGTSRETVVSGFAQSGEFRANTAADLKAWVRSQGVDDVIDGGSGSNVLAGGMLADTFVFEQADDGTHLVLDLEEWDYIDLNGFNYSSVAAARSQMTQTGNSFVFEDQGTTITFERASLDSLTDDVFLI